MTLLRNLPDHRVAASALQQAAPPTASPGVVIGFDDAGRPVPVRLFRPVPTRVVLATGATVGRVLAFRALACGAQLNVLTDRRRLWEALVRDIVTAGQPRVSIAPPGRPPTGGGSMHRPVLTVHDVGPTAADPHVPAAPWRTALTVLPHVTASDVPAVGSADLVVAQRCPADRAAALLGACGVGERHLERLTTAPEDGLALIAAGRITFVRARLTRTEIDLLVRPATG